MSIAKTVREVRVEIVVKGRNVEVPEHYRIHVAEKLDKIQRYDGKLIRVDVELFHERNPRQADHAQRIEITCGSRGPVVRAEACASDFYAALDLAVDKLQARLRRAADRRRVHRGRRVPVSVAQATASGAGELITEVRPEPDALVDDADDAPACPMRIVREKQHSAEPMTVDDALFNMELVGHDFYLFLDKDSGQPSVVYRRHGYDYGVISLTA
jgi:ribosomal subunit interface protein